MDEGFQIFISLPTDDVCTLKDLSEETRIYQLKSRVELKTGIPGDVQHLYFMNKQLYDNYKLEDVKLKAGCIVRVKLETTWLNLFEACWRGDIYEVFQNGVQYLDEKEFQGYNIPLWNRIVVQRATNALFIASHRGFLGLILELLNHGAADINGKTRFGRTCLHVAAYQGFIGCVSLLLSEGALCNQIDYNGKTALALASENGHIYCERRLWLYQMSLKSLGGLSQNSKAETTDSLDRSRPQLRNSVKALRLNANKILLKEADEKREHKNVDFHLPRVQTYDVRNSPRSAPVFEENEQGRSPFPFVQIVEKYRREYNMSNNISPPNMGGKTNNSRPRTAPVSSSPRENEDEPWARNEVHMVTEANTVESEVVKHKNGGTDTCDDEVFANEKVVVDDTTEKTKLLKRDTKALFSEEPIVITDNDKPEKERPQTSKPYVRRHLDLVISTAHERKSNEENTPKNALSCDLPSPSDEPESHTDFDVTEYAYRPRKPGHTFENWLEKKRNQGHLRPMTAHAPEKSKMGKSIDPDVFKNWLNKKRRNHSRSNSESSSTSPAKTYISSGMTFERWLEEKKKMESKEITENSATETPDTGRRARAVLAGKTYEVWLNEKMKQVQSTSKNDEENKKNGPKSGKTFEMWLLEKHNQKKIEIIHKATEEKERQRQLVLEQYQKYLNPNYRTFEEWLAIKKQEHLLERERLAECKQNEPSSEEKKKDADLVFGIWLTMKVVQEMKEEEAKYDEMKEKWERKEKQRAALRRAIHMNRLMKQQNGNSEVNEESCKALSLSWS